MNKPLKVILFFGGIDNEHNISLSTIRSFLDHSTYNINGEIFYLDQQGIFYKIPREYIYANNYQDFYHHIKIKDSINFHQLIDYLQNENNIIVWNLIHGLYGDDGQINELLNKNNIPFIGGTNAYCYDKYFFNQWAKKNGLKSINFFLLDSFNLNQLYSVYNEINDNKLYILKPQKGGSSLGVQLIKKQDLLMVVHKSWKEWGAMILEEYFEGIEFSMVILDENYSWKPNSQLIFIKKDTIYTYKNKYMMDENIIYSYLEIPLEHQQLIIDNGKKFFKEFNLKGMIRLDGIINQDKYIFNDCNMNPAIDQNSLVLKTKLGTLKNIFDEMIENTINNYCPQYQSLITTYHETFYNDDYYLNYINILKKFLIKIGHKLEDLNIIHQWFRNPQSIKILTGGNSNEKNISLLSGSNVFFQLSNSFLINPEIFCWIKEDIYPMKYSDCSFNTLKNLSNHLTNPQKIHEWIGTLPNNAWVFLGLHGGDGENGQLQSLLKNYYYNGCNEYWSEIFMDKYATCLKLQSYDENHRFFINIKKNSYRWNKTDTLNNYLQDINYHTYNSLDHLWQQINAIKSSNKLVSNDNNKRYYYWCAKPYNDGSSVNIKIIKNFQDFQEYVHQYNNNFILEEFISTKDTPWVELTVGFINEYCFFPSIALSAGDFLSVEEKFQYGLGVNVMKSQNFNDQQYKIIQNYVETIMKNLGFNSYCRWDLFFNIDNNKIYFIEINTLPALTPATVLYQQAALEGLNQRQLLECIIINDTLNKHKEINDKSYN